MKHEDVRKLLKYAELDMERKRKLIEFMVELITRYKYELDDRVFKAIEIDLINKLNWYKNNTQIIHKKKLVPISILIYKGNINE